MILALFPTDIDSAWMRILPTSPVAVAVVWRLEISPPFSTLSCLVFTVISLRLLAAELFENHVEVAIAVLSALMLSTAPAVGRKLRLFWLIVESDYVARLKELLTYLVQYYLRLTPEEEVEMSKLMAEPQYQPVVEFISSWRQKLDAALRAGMEALVLAMVVLSPWAYGAVDPEWEFWLYLAVALLLPGGCAQSS